MYGIPEKLIAYREELKKLYNSLCCVICMDLFKEPVTTTCGHSFCHHCIDKVTKVAKSTCPLCKTAVTRRHVTENPQIKALVEAYRTLAKEFRNAGVEMNFCPVSPQSELEVVHVIAPANPKSSKLGKKILPQSNPSLAHGLLVNLPKNADTKEISDTPKIPSRHADNIVDDNQLASTSCDVLSTPPLLESLVSKSLNVASTPAEKDPYTFVPSQRSPEKKRAPKKRQTRTKSNQKATAFLRSNAKRASKTSSTAEPTTVSTDKLQNALSRHSLEEREYEVVLFESQPTPNDNRTLEDIPMVTIPESPQKKRRGTPKKRAQQQVTAKASKKADVEEQIESIRLLFDDIDKQELNIVPSSNVEARKENSLQTKTRKKVTFQDHQDQSNSIEPRPSTSTSNSTVALDIPTVTTDLVAEKIPESTDVISRSSTNDPGQISTENAAVVAFSTGTVANVKRSSPGWSRLQEMKQDLGNNKKGLVAIAIKQGRDSLSKSIHRLPKTHVDIALDSRVRKPTEVQSVSAIPTSEIPAFEPTSNSLPEPVTVTKLVQDVADVKQSTEGLAQVENHQSETPAVLAIAETQEISPEPVTKGVVRILNEGVEPQVPLATAHAQSKNIIFVKKGRLATLKKGLAKKAILFHSLGALRKERTFLSYGKRPFAFIDDFSDSETQTTANKKHCTDNVQPEIYVTTNKVFKNTSVQTDEGWSFENRAVLGMFGGDAEQSLSVSLADTLPIVSETNKSDQKDVEVLDTEPVSHKAVRQLEKTDSDDMDIPDTVPVPEILNLCDNAKPSLEVAEEPVSISVNRTSARMSLLSTSCALPRYSLASTAQFDNEASSDSSSELLISSPEKPKTVMERIRANNDDLYSSEADGSPEPRQSHRIVAKVLPVDTTSKLNKKRKFRRIRAANPSDSDSDEEIKVTKESKRNKLSNTAAVKKRADLEREVEELSSQLQPEGDSEEILQRALEESKRELFEAGHVPAVEIVSLTGSSTTKVSSSEGSTAARSLLYPTATRNAANMRPFITSTTKSGQSPILTLQRSDSAKSASSGGIPSPSQSILASAAVARTRTAKTYNSPPRTANSGLFSMESMPTLASEALDADTYLFGEANDNGKHSPFKVLPKSLETMDLEAAVLEREEASLAEPKGDMDDLFDEDEYATDIFIGLDAELCKLELIRSCSG